MTATTILLVRHGETDWNRDRRIQGHTDIPLNDEGRRQARALSHTLDTGSLAAVYSSTLARAVETARILAATRPLDVTELDGLRERSFGTWEGLTGPEVAERFPDAAPGRWETWGDGEAPAEMIERVLGTIHAIAAAHPGETVLVVTHGGPMRAVLRSCGAEDGGIGNCAVVRLAVQDAVLRRVH